MPPSVEQQAAAFLAKFDPATAKLISACRRELRRVLPSAVELIYDNYNFLVFGFCSTRRPSTGIVSVAGAANGVILSFYYGASLADPHGLLQGSGAQNRFVRIASLEAMRSPNVVALVEQAAANAKVPLVPGQAGSTLVQSVSAKQRPRRRVSSGI